MRILETGPLSTTLFKFRVPAGRPAWQSPCLACDLVSNEMRPPLTVESAAEQSRAERRRGRKSYCHSRTIAAPLSRVSHSQSQQNRNVGNERRGMREGVSASWLRGSGTVSLNIS